MKKIKDDILQSYQRFSMQSFSKCKSGNYGRDSFLFLVFLRLYNSSTIDANIELDNSLGSLAEFYDCLETSLKSLPKRSAIQQAVEDSIACFKEAEQSELLKEIKAAWNELAYLDIEQNSMRQIDALNLYRWVLHSFQQMNAQDIFSIEVDPIHPSSAYGEYLKVCTKDINSKRWYIGQDQEAEASISLVTFEPSIPIALQTVNQSSRHIFRYLALVGATDVEVFEEEPETKYSRCLNINTPQRLGINFINNNSDEIKEAPPRYNEFKAASALLNTIENNGEGYVFLSKIALNRQQDMDIRKAFVERGWVNSVVMLPERMFGKQVYELILVKLKRNSETVKFIDARHCYQAVGGIQKPARLSELRTLLDADGTNHSRFWQVPLNNILKNNASLNPHAYESLALSEAKNFDDLSAEYRYLAKQLSLTDKLIVSMFDKFNSHSE